MDDSIDSPSSLSVSGAQEDGCGTGNTYIPRDPRLTGRFFTGISNPLTGTALSPRVWHPASSYAGVRPLDVSANQPVYRNPKDDQTSSIQTSTIISMSPASSCLPLPVSVSPSVSPSTDTSFLNDPKISKILDGLAKAKLPSTPSPASPSGSLVGGNIVFQRLVENRNKRSNFLEDARKLNAKISELYSEAQKKKESADKLTQARDMIMAGVKNLENEELILLNQLQCQPLISSQSIAQDDVSEALLVNEGQEIGGGGGGDGSSGDARPVVTDEEFQPRRLEKRPLEEDSSKTPNKTPVSSIKRLCLHTTSSASKVNSPVRANGSPVKIDRICRREQCLHDKTSKTPSKNDGKSFGVKGSKPVKANPGKKKIEATPSSVMSGITPKTTGSSTPATAPSSTTSVPVASVSSTPLTVQSAAPAQLVPVKQEPQDNYPAPSPAATKSQAVEQQVHQPEISKLDDTPSSTTNNLLNKSVSRKHTVNNRQQVDKDDNLDFGSGQEAVPSQVNPGPPTQTVSHASGKQSFANNNREEEEDQIIYDKENSSFFSPFVSARKVKREYHVQEDFFENFNDVDYGTQDEEEVITGT